MKQQDLNLRRVRARISGHVLAFCKLHVGEQFHLASLTAYVQALMPGAPDSASRILRDLRQSGAVAYRVVNRAQSLYEITGVNERQAA